MFNYAVKNIGPRTNLINVRWLNDAPAAEVIRCMKVDIAAP